MTRDSCTAMPPGTKKAWDHSLGRLSTMLHLLAIALVICCHDSIVPSVNAMNWVSRDDWGALPAKESMPRSGSERGVKIHYTGSYLSEGSHTDCAGKMQTIQEQHQNDEVNGYGDIAYNIGVCQHGYVFDGRGAKYRSGANGDAELNKNHYSVLALIGSEGDTEPSSDMVQGIQDAITYLRGKGAGDEIKGHRDGFATQCPGGPLYELVTSGELEPGSSGGDDEDDDEDDEDEEDESPGCCHEPFPGASWFKSSPKSPIVTAMGQRLVEEGCSAYRDGPGAQWTDADRESYGLWQEKLGYIGVDADGWPGATSWAKLKVPCT